MTNNKLYHQTFTKYDKKTGMCAAAPIGCCYFYDRDAKNYITQIYIPYLLDTIKLCPTTIDKIKHIRRTYTLEREHWENLKKITDTTFGSYCKKETRRYLRYERACGFILTYLQDNPQVTIPVELGEEVFTVFCQLNDD